MKKEKHPSIAELEHKISELTCDWQRTQADFVNFKNKAQEERAKICKKANADLVYELLPVLDNFQLAAKHVPKKLENDNWAQGIKQIEKQLENILAGLGLEKIESVGAHFNPEIHEAVEYIPSEKPENEVVDEVLSGYKFNGQLLRPAKVKVSCGNSNK